MSDKRGKDMYRIRRNILRVLGGGGDVARVI